MRLNWSLGGLVLGAIVWALGGCSQPAGGPSAPGTTTEKSTPGTGTPPKPGAPSTRKLAVGIMPKSMDIEYFQKTKSGAEWAAKELGVDLIYDGPHSMDPAEQTMCLEAWIPKRFDAIAVAPNDPQRIASTLEKARAAGTKVLTWDADAAPNSRIFFVNQCANDVLAKDLVDAMAQGTGGQGDYLYLSGPSPAANQKAWIAAMEAGMAATCPGMKNLRETPVATPEDPALAKAAAAECFKTYPSLRGIFAMTSVGLPAAAEALREAGLADRIFLTGLSTPNAMREYLLDGTCKKVVMWNVPDLGYLTVYAAVALAKDELKPGMTSLNAGHLGVVQVRESEIVMGAPLVLDKDNVGQYDF